MCCTTFVTVAVNAIDLSREQSRLRCNKMSSTWQPRPNAYNDPVCIIGAGVLGRRLATMWASRGGTVHIVDTIEAVREAALRYFEETDKPVQVRREYHIRSAVSELIHILYTPPARLPTR